MLCLIVWVFMVFIVGVSNLVLYSFFQVICDDLFMLMVNVGWLLGGWLKDMLVNVCDIGWLIIYLVSYGLVEIMNVIVVMLLYDVSEIVQLGFVMVLGDWVVVL